MSEITNSHEGVGTVTASEPKVRWKRLPRIGRRALAVGVALLILAGMALPQGLTTRISTSSSGVQGDAASDYPSLSFDGRYVVFSSLATNLVPGDANGVRDVFVRDTLSGQVSRVSVSSTGEQGNGPSGITELGQHGYSAITPDGRFVVFTSFATNLVPDDTNERSDVFLHDRTTATTTRVSVSSTGEQGIHRSSSSRCSVSDDGRYIAFYSDAANFATGMQGSGVFVRDRLAGTTTHVSVTSSGVPGNHDSYTPAISGDGRVVAFGSRATNLVPGDADGNDDVFLHDLQTGQTTCVSVSSAGVQGNRLDEWPSLSADGRFVAYMSNSNNLVVGDTNDFPVGGNDTFVHDRLTGTTERVSVDSAGNQQDRGSGHFPSISADGRYVAFMSNSTNLVPGSANSAIQIYVHDRQEGDTQRASVSSGGDMADLDCIDFSLSPDGCKVAFDSFATNLVPGDTNATLDVFLHAFCSSNLPPVADAGFDRVAPEGQLVVLDGRGSIDPEGAPLTFHWTQVSGPVVTLIPDPIGIASFLAPFVGAGGATLTFELTVSDGVSTSQPDFVNVTVLNINQPPVANAGDPQAVSEGSLVTLDGSASFDPDSDPLTHLWMQTAGTTVTLDDPTAVKPTFVAPEVGPGGETLTFSLLVLDGLLGAVDTVNVQVSNSNQPPVADAGLDLVVDEGSLVTLQGTASDPDGDLLSFSWTQVLGTPVALADATTLMPSFLAPTLAAGNETLVFRLAAFDGELTTSSEVTVLVRDANAPPACGMARASVETLWPPNHAMVPVAIVNVTDAEGGDVQITITSVTQDEPTNGLGDGDTGPDAVIESNGKVLLRAERAGGGNGRVYVISFTAVDELGQSCTGSVRVAVPHSKKKDTPAVDDGQSYDARQ